MLILTDQEIETLISCPKKITRPPSKNDKLAGRNRSNGMQLVSLCEGYRFSVFFRQNDEFEENFSIGLVYHPVTEKESIHLFRCNGPHGCHKLYDHHVNCHVHLATKENIQAGLKPERFIKQTDEYTCYLEAKRYFISRCSIKNAGKYFPPGEQLNLFK